MSHNPTTIIIPQTEDVCQVQSGKLANVNMSETLALADVALTQARQFRAEYLATGDPLAWRRWRACAADREALLGEVGRP